MITRKQRLLLRINALKMEKSGSNSLVWCDIGFSEDTYKEYKSLLRECECYELFDAML